MNPRHLLCVLLMRGHHEWMITNGSYFGILLAEGNNWMTTRRKNSSWCCYEYADVFASDPEDFGRTDETTHKIDTGDSHPIRQRMRRIPPCQREEARKHAQEECHHSVKEPMGIAHSIGAQEEWVPSLLRIDYRKGNEITRKDAYPIPRINDTLDVLAGSIDGSAHWT